MTTNIWTFRVPGDPAPWTVWPRRGPPPPGLELAFIAEADRQGKTPRESRIGLRSLGELFTISGQPVNAYPA